MFKVIARYAPAVAVFGVLMSFGVSAQAAERGAEIPAVTVRYGDLNLNTPAGVDALYARLRAAARTACDVRGGRPLAEQVLARSCYQQVLGAAVDNVKSLSTLAQQQLRGQRDQRRGG